MTAALDAQPRRREQVGDFAETCVFCCDPNRGLCGEVLHGEFVDSDDDTTCAMCDLLDERDAPCGAPLCRLRQRWRRWFR